MGSTKKKFSWNDVDEIAFLLIDKFPAQDAKLLRLEEIKERVMALPNFAAGKNKKVDPTILELIQTTWSEEREDMEDELGPVGVLRGGDGMDEDEYRDDIMIDELTNGMSGDDDDDEVDDFQEGFQTGDEDELS